MKKILGLTVAALLVMALVGGGTWAYFTDVETTSPTFTAGTIDLAVNDENPWATDTITTELTDLKPCETGWVTITLKNVGDNPMDIWKMITVGTTTGGEANYPPSPDIPVASSEPEWQECGGPTTYVEECDIDGVIRYDLKVDTVEKIAETDDYTISDGTHGLGTTGVADYYIYLGTLAKDDTMTVEQSYHMDGDTTNWAQGDTMPFTIEFFAQQTVGGAPAPTPQLPGYEKQP